MSFTLRWNNPNTIATVVNIYRDTKDISPSALPAPLATLSNGETEYRDTTAVSGQTYYYLTTVTANGKIVATASQKYTVAVRRGIGPNTLISGDDRLGFYGAVATEDQWYGSQLPAGFLAMFPTAFATTDRVPLNKFTRGGKIFYMLTSISPGWATWADLYRNGLVYGTGDFGPTGGHGTLTDTLQDAKIISQNETYRMRLVRGLSSASASPAFAFNEAYNAKTHDETDLTAFNEYNDLFYPIVVDVPNKQRVPNVSQLATTYLGFNGSASGQPYTNGGVVCMEHDTAQDRVMHRGLQTPLTVAQLPAVQAMQRITYSAPTQQGRYIPIIELVE
ncbi:hypothetical protein pEaSNUABM11_00170 [Erwinia phage pEa_SNUABM_11]|nr:hypothetical protein pEaSNUABM11_00170 [Erwinia phage pEa_SNUABM_11]